jgi:DNA-binding transcriptional ArsR family regulator
VGAPARAHRDAFAGEFRLDVDRWEGTSVRVVVSPMHTAFASIFEIVAGLRRGVDERWVQTVLRRAAGLDLAPFAPFAVPGVMLPNFILPVPRHPDPAFAEELAEVRSLRPRAIRKGVLEEYGSAVPAAFQPWLDDPQATVARYCEALAAWWEAVLAPSWPAIQAALQAEVLRIARLLVTHPLADALARIHPRLAVEAGNLHWSSYMDVREHVGARPLVLMPFASGPDGILSSLDNPEAVILGYSAAGTADVLGGDETPPGEDLAQLLGQARAQIMLRLATPATTLGLSDALLYSPSTVSSHLHTLALMGLVRSARVSRFVYYERTPRAEGLLRLYA